MTTYQIALERSANFLHINYMPNVLEIFLPSFIIMNFSFSSYPFAKKSRVFPTEIETSVFNNFCD